MSLLMKLGRRGRNRIVRVDVEKGYTRGPGRTGNTLPKGGERYSSRGERRRAERNPCQACRSESTNEVIRHSHEPSKKTRRE